MGEEKVVKMSIGQKMKRFRGLKKRLVLDGIVVGILAGTFSVLYRLALVGAENARNWIYDHDISPYVLLWGLALLLLGYIVGWLLKYSPLSSGSGIPQVSGELLGYFNMNEKRIVVAKFLGGFSGSIAGLSLGREGPSIQIGAAVAKWYSRLRHKTPAEERYMITAGASAGLSAAFNAPVSATIFALEEVHKSFSPYLVVPCIIAAIVADFISKNIFGIQPVFTFHIEDVVPLRLYLHLVAFGAFAGVVGVAFNIMILKCQDFYKKLPIPAISRPMVAMVVAGILGYTTVGVVGAGHGLLESLPGSGFTLKVMVFYLAAKLLFTTFSYGSGAQGGIFLPVLVLGGLAGCLYLKLFNGLFPALSLSEVYMSNFVILGMAAVLSAVVRSPIMSILLVSEMTGSFQYILGLSVVSIMAYVLAEGLNNPPIYDSLLLRMHGSEVNDMPVVRNERTLLEVRLPMNSPYAGKKLSELNWSKELLIVAVVRDEKEFFPCGSDILEGGDRLTVLTTTGDVADVKRLFRREGDEGIEE